MFVCVCVCVSIHCSAPIDWRHAVSLSLRSALLFSPAFPLARFYASKQPDKIPAYQLLLHAGCTDCLAVHSKCSPQSMSERGIVVHIRSLYDKRNASMRFVVI